MAKSKTTKTAANHQLQIDFGSNALLLELCGYNDAHLHLLEEKLGVELVARGTQLAILGAKQQVEQAQVILEDLYDILKTGMPLGIEQVEAALRVTQGLGDSNLRPADLMSGEAVIATPHKKIMPRSVQQHAYLAALQSSSLTFGLGSAGTGKTYLATAIAVQGVLNKSYKKVVLTRPVMEAGENLGFLPGTLEEKIDPYLRPFFDAFEDMIGPDKLTEWREKNIIELAPLAYMRGRTLENCLMILDEAQNTTPVQMRLFLTRMGQGSKCIVTGDLSQSDLPKHLVSGLKEAVDTLEHLPGIETVRFSEADVVRHDLVAKIVQAYDEKDRENNK